MRLSPIQARRAGEVAMVQVLVKQGMPLPQAHALANTMLIALRQSDLSVIHLDDLMDAFSSDMTAKTKKILGGDT